MEGKPSTGKTPIRCEISDQYLYNRIKVKHIYARAKLYQT